MRDRVRTQRVLLADDETIVRLDLRDLLGRAGFDVCAEARDGEEAVALALSARPDVALLDVTMPRLDGIEAARQIMAARPIPIVMLTAHSDDALVARAVASGVHAYLVKPFREADVLPAIRTAAARHADLIASRRRAGDSKLGVFVPPAVAGRRPPWETARQRESRP
jgi:response regulator NasT